MNLRQNAKTILAAAVFAALFSAVATQIYGIVMPITDNALTLLALFFAVGIGVAWATMQLDARWQRTKRNPESAGVGVEEKPAATAEAE